MRIVIAEPILALGAARAVVENAGVPPRLPSGEPDPGLVLYEDEEAEAAMTASSPRSRSVGISSGRIHPRPYDVRRSPLPHLENFHGDSA